jgi:hypothetical protein
VRVDVEAAASQVVVVAPDRGAGASWRRADMRPSRADGTPPVSLVVALVVALMEAWHVGRLARGSGTRGGAHAPPVDNGGTLVRRRRRLP